MRMHEASRQRAYTGTMVVSAGATMSTSRVAHVCDGTQQMEQIENLTGAPQITLRRNDEVMTLNPESRTARLEKRTTLGQFPELLRTSGSHLADWYAAVERSPERVAGHWADVVDIQPKDAWRFGFRIWAEKQTGLVLKMQTLGEQGAVLEQIAFTELQLDAPVSMGKLVRLMKDTRGYEVQRVTLRKTTPEAEGWRLKEGVPGFVAVSCHVRETSSNAPGEGASMGAAPMQWVFSDGLASVSLFVEPFDAQRHTQEKTLATGATHSLTRRVGGYWLTVLGEVPAPTLRRFASALERGR
jgi:sigma-E factor negative regulatory protein RseB